MNNQIPFPEQSHSLMAANCYGSNLGSQVTPHPVKNRPFRLFKTHVFQFAAANHLHMIL